MEKVSFDIVLNLKNNISGALANVRKIFVRQPPGSEVSAAN